MMSLVESTVKQPEQQAAESGQFCWLEVKRYPYQPDHQVELMHLQAEADALLIKLQAHQSVAHGVRPEPSLEQAPNG